MKLKKTYLKVNIKSITNQELTNNFYIKQTEKITVTILSIQANV